MKRHVLVYYANETCIPLARLRVVERRAAWMLRYGDTTAAAAADRVMDDLRRFPQTTHRHIVEIQRIVGESCIDAALLFTNELAKGGWYESLTGAASYRSPFTDTTAARPFPDDAPLSSPDALRAALRETALRYPPSEYDYLLVTRSHGTEAMALTTAMLEATLDHPQPLPTEEESAGKGQESARKVRSIKGWAELGGGELGPFFLGVFYGIGAKGMVLGGAKEASEGSGVTKEEYLEVLEEAGTDLEMSFRLVFMDSCGSELPTELSCEVPRNVESLFGSKPEGLTYEAPDFARLGANLPVPDHQDGIVEAFKTLLRETPNVVQIELDQHGCRCRCL